MRIRDLLIAGGIAGLAMALLSNLPLVQFGNCFACMWLWGSGMAGVWLYQRLTGSTRPMTTSQGAVVGALSGFIGAFVGAAIGSVTLAGWIVSNSGDVFRQVGLEDTISAVGSSSITASILLLLVNACVFPIVGAIGGAIGSTILERGARAT